MARLSLRTSLLTLSCAALAAGCSKQSPKPVAAPKSHEDFRAAIPPAGPKPTLVAPVPTVKKLSNGLTLMVVRQSDLPIVSYRLVVATGSAHDPKGKEGLASLTGSLLQSGTKTKSATELNAAIELLGSSIGVSVDEETLSLSASALAENGPKVLDLLAEIVESPAFAEDELARLKKKRLIALQQESDSPARVALRAFYKTLYGEHPFGHVVLGGESSIEAIKRTDVVEFYREHMVPERAALIVVGDVDPTSFEDTVRNELGDWEPGQSVAMATPEVEPEDAKLILVDRPGAPQSQLLLGHPSVPRSHPDYFALVLANAILGGQFNSRINLNLREDKGYTYGARSAFDFRRGNGPFYVQTAVRTDVTSASIREIIGEVEKFRDSGVTAEELESARSNYSNSLPGYFQSRGAIASMMSNLFVYGLPLDYYQALPSKLGAVTIEDVKRVAREHILPDKLSIVVVGDKRAVEAELGTLERGTVDVRDTDDGA